MTGTGDKMDAMFSVHVSEYSGNKMLNICDHDLLGRSIGDEDASTHAMHISESYYGGSSVSRDEAALMLAESSIINMVGSNTVSLAVDLGIGSKEAVRMISDVPFLIVFKM